MRRVIGFLMTRWGALVLSVLMLALAATIPSIERSLAHWGGADRQFNSYYWTTVFWGMVGLWLVAWVTPIILFVARKRFGLALFRTVFGALVVVAALSAWYFISLGASAMAGRPISTVHSPARDCHYILATRDGATITPRYVVLSAEKTLLAVTWAVEFSGWDMIDAPEVVPAPVRLLLSEDQELLVIAHGDHFTDAFDLSTRERLVGKVSVSDVRREELLRERTERIQSLLAEHAGPERSGGAGEDAP